MDAPSMLLGRHGCSIDVVSGRVPTRIRASRAGLAGLVGYVRMVGRPGRAACGLDGRLRAARAPAGRRAAGGRLASAGGSAVAWWERCCLVGALGLAGEQGLGFDLYQPG